MLFQVLRNINRMHYRPITNKNQHGSTYTAQAMEHALKEIFTAEAGWRNGTTGGAEPVKVKIRLRLDTAATVNLCSCQLSLDKHYTTA